MKILSLAYKDLKTQWELENMDFNNFSLLVGASSVGKTKILEALKVLRNVALGDDLPFIKWEIVFNIGEKDYKWTGQVPQTNSELSRLLNIITDNKVYRNNNILTGEQKEQLIDIQNEKIIFERIGDKIEYMGEQIVPKLTNDKSGITLFANEKLFKQIKNGFKRMFFFQFESERQVGLGEVNFANENVTEEDLERIKKFDIPILAKLATVYKYFREGIFEDIKTDFIDIFPAVEDVRFKIHKHTDSDGDEFERYDLEIKERDVIWVTSSEISSGMLKTLLYISMLYLVPKDSVLIMDEFENSLGVNCIDIASENSCYGDNNKQFIITSHHPYIINNINMESWKIISRKGSRVIGRDSSYYKLGKSKHEAFKQLINLTVYSEGRE